MTALAAVAVLFLVVVVLEWQGWRRQRLLIALQEAVEASQTRLEALYADYHADRKLLNEAIALLSEAKELFLREQVRQLAEDMRRADGPLSRIPTKAPTKERRK